MIPATKVPTSLLQSVSRQELGEKKVYLAYLSKTSPPPTPTEEEEETEEKEETALGRRTQTEQKKILHGNIFGADVLHSNMHSSIEPAH